MSFSKNLKNMKFGKLFVIEKDSVRNNHSYWKCICDCGDYKIVSASHLKSGHTKSCGCNKKTSKKKSIINFIGKKIGKLAVISLNRKTKDGNYWNCLCDCGNKKIVSTNKLNNNKVSSCGCDKVKIRKIKNDLTGKKFNRLTVINNSGFIIVGKKKKSRTIWNCICDCGNAKIVSTLSLIKGTTKSCGCFKIESNKKSVRKAQISNLKHDPVIYSAKCVWWNTYKENNGISFEDFYNLSQQNCFYCNLVPSREYNGYKKRKNTIIDINNQNTIFKFNGLDRIDSSKNHTIDNCVSCCYTCNMAKRHFSIDWFNDYISMLITAKHIDFYEYRSKSNIIEMCDLNKKHFGSSVKCIFKDYYNDSDLTIEQFYKLSQLNCYYCGNNPQNNFNKGKKIGGEFIYNGLDRINNDLSHNYENVITCCKYCNFTKSNKTVNDFFDWINRLKNNYDNLQRSMEQLLCR